MRLMTWVSGTRFGWWAKSKFPGLYSYLAKHHTRQIPLDTVSIDAAFVFAEKLSDSLSRDYDCVIGIPRAGLLFANVASMKLGIPLSTPELFCQGTVWSGWNKKVEKDHYSKVLLFNDDITDGIELHAMREMLKVRFPDLQVDTACVCASVPAIDKVDHYERLTKVPTIFEWSFIHHPLWPNTCVDLDGVLCRNENHSEPYIIPRYRIDTILTARHEYERSSTKEWLAANNVNYDKLIMCPDNEHDQIGFKVRELKKLKPSIYWESEPQLAAIFSKQAGLLVFCPADFRVYRP